MSAAERARRARFRQFMADYYAARQADLAHLEAVTAMLYFKRYLIASRGLPR